MKHWIRRISSVLFYAAILSGCASSKLFVANTLALSGNYVLNADVAYGPDPRQRLDLYEPERPATSPKTLVIFIPGGCWGACQTFPKEDYRFVADALTAEGYRVAILNYRLYPEVRFTEIIGDVAKAVNQLASDSVGRGGDTFSLVLMGHSAGAHLAAMLALDDRYLDPSTRSHLKGWIGLAGPYDFLPFKEAYQPVLFGPESHFPDSQPINFVTQDDPPALLLHGTEDDVVGTHNLVNLRERLKEAGVPVDARHLDHIDHGLIVGALARPISDNYPVLSAVLAFLRT